MSLAQFFDDLSLVVEVPERVDVGSHAETVVFAGADDQALTNDDMGFAIVMAN